VVAVSSAFGLRALYGTLRLMDDRTADFVIQPPKDQRILDVRKDLNQLAIKMQTAMQDLVPNINSAKLGRASMNIELKFTQLPPKDIRQKVASRIGGLTTLFQRIVPPKDEQKPFLSLRYKAVSNFKTDDRINSYLTYYFSRKGAQAGDQAKYAPEIAKEFQITEDEAIQYIAKFLTEKTQVTVSDSDGKDFLSLNNPGIDISIFSQNVNTFIIQLFNLRAVTLEDVRRVTTLISMAFYGDDAVWEMEEVANTVNATASEIMEASIAVEEEDRAEEEVGRGGGGGAGAAAGPNSAFDFFGYDGDEELVAASAAAAAGGTTKPSSKTAKAVKAKKEESQMEEEKIIPHTWFIKQLQKLDPVLFSADIKLPLPYTKKCAANEDRQPVILTSDQWDRIKTVYSRPDPGGDRRKDYTNRVAFIVYGEREPNPYTPAAAVGKQEKNKLTVMRYGSDPDTTFYFMCPPLFCLRDKLPIFEEDWESEEDYNGNEKDEESCPFCHGTIIEDRKLPKPNETVIRRKNKPKYTYPHKFIGFVKNPGHPQGYELPCCFISDQEIGSMDARFKAIRDRDRARTPADEREEKSAAKAAALDMAYNERKEVMVSYDVLVRKLPREYVVTSEKYPLEAGKVGLPSIELDKYFGQDSIKMTEQEAIKREFKPNVNGFFRLGVHNKPQNINQSLFAALAPILGFNTPSSVAKYMAKQISLRVFMNLNFGNLLLEFYDPRDQSNPIQKLRGWEVQYSIYANKNEYELNRANRAYHKFLDYCMDPTQKKQLRHFIHALAEPGLLTETGLTLIVVYYKGDPRDPATAVEVLCPMLGFEQNRYDRNDIAFMTFSDTGIWEPMVYIGRLSTTETTQESGFYKLAYGDWEDENFPQVVRQRIDEFKTKCRSDYRGAFTFQQGVDNRVLSPAEDVIKKLTAAKLKVGGVVRDSYNHLIAITVETPIEGRVGDILVPVVDDGFSYHDLKIYLNLDSVKKASAKDVEETYRIISKALTSETTLYALIQFIQTPSGIVGFKIGIQGVDILLPCGPLRAEDDLETPIQDWTGGEDTFLFEYKLDREIQIKSSDKAEPIDIGNEFIVSKKQVDDIYEHLRLSFANWIATAPGAEMRAFVERIITDSSIPSYEKIRRLSVEFGPTILRWFAEEDDVAPRQVLLRTDCIDIGPDQEKCNGAKMCKFKDGACKIHTPKRIQIRSTPNATSMEASKYFAFRLFDEIIRLPARRYELLHKGVKRVQIPKTNIHIGSEWILPENVPAWFDLLREGYSGLGREKPRYYEEFSREADEDETIDTLYSIKKIIRLRDPRVPESLRSVIPEAQWDTFGVKIVGDPNESRTESLMNYYDILIDTLDDTFTRDELKEFSEYSEKPVVQILTNDDPVIIQSGIHYRRGQEVPGDLAIVLLPLLELGPGVLISLPNEVPYAAVSQLTGPIQEHIDGERPVNPKIRGARRAVKAGAGAGAGAGAL
jgi:hypothetical protein